MNTMSSRTWWWPGLFSWMFATAPSAARKNRIQRKDLVNDATAAVRAVRVVRDTEAAAAACNQRGGEIRPPSQVARAERGGARPWARPRGAWALLRGGQLAARGRPAACVRVPRRVCPGVLPRGGGGGPLYPTGLLLTRKSRRPRAREQPRGPRAVAVYGPACAAGRPPGRRRRVTAAPQGRGARGAGRPSRPPPPLPPNGPLLRPQPPLPCPARVATVGLCNRDRGRLARPCGAVPPGGGFMAAVGTLPSARRGAPRQRLFGRRAGRLLLLLLGAAVLDVAAPPCSAAPAGSEASGGAAWCD